MQKWTIIASISSILLIVACLFGYQICQKQVNSSEFRSFTEEKVGEFLRSNVKIHNIQFRFLRKISLSGLEIHQKNSSDPILIGVKKIVIRYNLWNFLSRQFKAPVAILLDSPKFQLKPGESFLTAMMPAIMKPESGFFRRVELDDGEVEIPIPIVDQKLKLAGIKGKSSWAGHELQVDFISKADGFLEGDLDVKGALDSGFRSGRLNIHLKNMNWRSSTGVPIKNLNGDIELQGTRLIIHNISFDFKDIPCHLSGSVENIFSDHPIYHLTWRVVEEKKEFLLQTKVDLRNYSISGNFSAFGKNHLFKGRLSGGDKIIRLEDFSFGRGYEAKGEINFNESLFQLSAEREEQRFSVNMSFKDLRIDLDLNMTHLKIAGHDVATLAKLKLRPDEAVWANGKHHFNATVETAYLIFNYQPLLDFTAAFQISPASIENLKAKWAGISQLTGSITFTHPVTSDLILQISKLELNNIRRLGVHEFPAALGGELEGKIKMTGLLRAPTMDGQMSIQDGKVSEFDYELATLHFNGQYPRLIFTDSKITKKGKTYLLKGDVDFKLDNIVQNLKILSSDQIVMWKGWNLKQETENQDVPGSPGSNVAHSNKPFQAVGNSGVELEYSVKNGKSLTLVAEDSEDGKRFVGVGPKLKF